MRLTREELYDQVWALPMCRLAEQYGLSDVGLAKICRKMQIPMPGRGYWQKRKSGYKVKRSPLPSFKGCSEIEIATTEQTSVRKRDAQERNPDPRVTFEKLEENQIGVPVVIISPHVLVTRSESILRAAKKDERGILRPGNRRCLDIRVSPNSLDRALRAMDALIKALEARSYSVSVGPKEEVNSTSVEIDGEKLRFCIEETARRYERELTPAEKKNKMEYPHFYGTPMYAYSPTGKLRLRIMDNMYLGVRKMWSDGASQKVENCLNSFIIGLIRTAEAIKADRLQRQERDREAAERASRREELAARIREEESKIKDLEEEAASWHRSQKIRAYVNAVRDAAIAESGHVEPGSELDEWLSWAQKYADRLDPLVESPPSVLDRKSELGAFWDVFRK